MGVTPFTRLASWAGLCHLLTGEVDSWGGREQGKVLKPLMSLLGPGNVDLWGVREPPLGLKPLMSLLGEAGS